MARDSSKSHRAIGIAEPAGYADPAYAASLAEIGTPRMLGGCGGSILVRTIGETGYSDAMGPYPLFACADWARLEEDIEGLRGELVSVVLVSDPFGNWTAGQLKTCFPDLCAPFKEHFVVDLSRPPLQSASRHHQRAAARALRKSTVSLVDDPPAFLGEWEALYRNLIRRHDVRGPAAFSRASFAGQFGVRGLTVFRVDREGTLAGAALWFVDGAVAHYHLAAYTDDGYQHGVSHALFATALEHFADQGLEWAALGGGAGLTDRPTEGLSRFKAGWATGTRPVFLCGRVLNRQRYAELVVDPPALLTYFPAYRADEQGPIADRRR